jgi:hypothetical protein
MYNTNMEWTRVDSASVLSQLIDDEVFIIDVRVGNYYSLSGVSAAIWEALQSPCSIEEIVQLIQQNFSGTPTDLPALIQQFVDDLAAENLITVQPMVNKGPKQPISSDGAHQPFQTPILEKYSDMQALLLVDPIHDVDERGWPASPIADES